MGGRNLHNEPFDESTLTKLDLYRRYVRAWLPVFLNAPKLVVDRMQIFDFFADFGCINHAFSSFIWFRHQGLVYKSEVKAQKHTEN